MLKYNLGWTSTHIGKLIKITQNALKLFLNITNIPCLD
jgi:hypothetical protein